jgi:hypothetical protein
MIWLETGLLAFLLCSGSESGSLAMANYDDYFDDDDTDNSGASSRGERSVSAMFR